MKNKFLMCGNHGAVLAIKKHKKRLPPISKDPDMIALKAILQNMTQEERNRTLEKLGAYTPHE